MRAVDVFSDMPSPPEGTDSYRPATLTSKLEPSGRVHMTVHRNCGYPSSLTVSLLVDGAYYANAVPLLVERGADVYVVFEKGRPYSLGAGERFERLWAAGDCSGVGFVPARTPGASPSDSLVRLSFCDTSPDTAPGPDTAVEPVKPRRPEVEIEIDDVTYVVRPKLGITPYQSAMLAVFLRWEDEHYANNVKDWLAEHDLWQHFRPVKEASDDE